MCTEGVTERQTLVLLSGGLFYFITCCANRRGSHRQASYAAPACTNFQLLYKKLELFEFYFYFPPARTLIGGCRIPYLSTHTPTPDPDALMHFAHVLTAVVPFTIRDLVFTVSLAPRTGRDKGRLRWRQTVRGESHSGWGLRSSGVVCLLPVETRCYPWWAPTLLGTVGAGKDSPTRYR